jgi:hypothetical protein
MKIITVLTLLCCGAAFADPPKDAPTVSECDKPGAPADVPGTSYCIRTAGEPAPIPGRLLSFDENRARGKDAADCKGTLANAEANGVLLSKAGAAALISGAAAAVVASIVLGVALAAKK